MPAGSPAHPNVIGTGWHSGLTGKAGVADAAPATWDDFLASAKKIVDSQAAPWGATFDSHGWRSLAPVRQSTWRARSVRICWRVTR